jgi:hypothetical protein
MASCANSERKTHNTNDTLRIEHLTELVAMRPHADMSTGDAMELKRQQRRAQPVLEEYKTQPERYASRKAYRERTTTERAMIDRFMTQSDIRASFGKLQAALDTFTAPPAMRLEHHLLDDERHQLLRDIADRKHAIGPRWNIRRRATRSSPRSPP